MIPTRINITEIGNSFHFSCSKNVFHESVKNKKYRNQLIKTRKINNKINRERIPKDCCNFRIVAHFSIIAILPENCADTERCSKKKSLC